VEEIIKTLYTLKIINYNKKIIFCISSQSENCVLIRTDKFH